MIVPNSYFFIEKPGCVVVDGFRVHKEKCNPGKGNGLKNTLLL